MFEDHLIKLRNPQSKMGSVYLDGNICERCDADLCHPMQTSIAQSPGFWHMLHRARWSENILECLEPWVRCGCNISFCYKSIWLTEIKSLLWRKPFHGPLGLYSEFFQKKISHWSPGMIYLPLFSFIFTLFEAVLHFMFIDCRKRTYSELNQFRPAGQRREPVALWLNPWSSLLLHASSGIRGWSCRVIQLMTALLRPLVSSDCPLLHPFCNFFWA